MSFAAASWARRACCSASICVCRCSRCAMRSNSSRSFALSSAMLPKSKDSSAFLVDVSTSSHGSSLSRRGGASGTRPRSHLPPLARGFSAPALTPSPGNPGPAAPGMPERLVRSRLSRRLLLRQSRMISSGSTGSRRTGSAASLEIIPSGMCASAAGKAVSRGHRLRIAFLVCRTTSLLSFKVISSGSACRNGSFSRDELRNLDPSRESSAADPCASLPLPFVAFLSFRGSAGAPLVTRRPQLAESFSEAEVEMDDTSSAASVLKDSWLGFPNFRPPWLHCGPSRRRVPPGLIMVAPGASPLSDEPELTPLRRVVASSSSSSIPKALRERSRSGLVSFMVRWLRRRRWTSRQKLCWLIPRPSGAQA
mmetsp:Transcript_13980/g.52207  ORF Transcript_13980/g.52207 Transcript_13980/m.52207 type:complete len:366 (+) Transcript_13980:102-1199(+)